MALWHERDLANSANERIVIPHAIVLADDLLAKLAGVFRHLRADPERMAENLALTGGAPMAESLMLALTARGVPRSESHEILRSLTRADSAGGSLADRARADPAVRRRLGDAEIDRWLRPDAYVAAAREKTLRVLDRLAAELDG
jgi:adenylosuccinate lyase